MTEIGLLPLLVLALGLAIGLVLAFRLQRPEILAEEPDLALRIADLEAERDQLYRKLRGEEGERPEAADREALERRAATVLRDLDRLAPRAIATRSPASGGARDPKTGAVPAGGFVDRHPLLAGALLGGSLVALVAVLLVWAQRDARPDPNRETGLTESAGPGAAPRSGIDRGEPPLPAEIAAQVASLRSTLEESPEDLAAHRDLVQILLAHGQFFDAFGAAQSLLARNGEDPVATYAIGVVRYTMGQPDEALDWLDRSIAADPAFTQAALIRGVLLLQRGDREGAIASWQQALDAVEGGEPTLERLLRDARAGLPAEQILRPPG